MSHSPTAQQAHGTGSGRRTMPTTRSPGLKPESAGASRTRPSDSWPRISRSSPGGAQAYSPRMISPSVPQIPSASPSASTEPWLGSGSGTSSSRAEPAWRGTTVIARMLTTLGRAERRVVDEQVADQLVVAGAGAVGLEVGDPLGG